MSRRPSSAGGGGAGFGGAVFVEDGGSITINGNGGISGGTAAGGAGGGGAATGGMGLGSGIFLNGTTGLNVMAAAGETITISDNIDSDAYNGAGYENNDDPAGDGKDGGVVQSGPGTLELRGTNTYIGGTTAKGGTINIVADNNLGHASGGLALDGGTLQLGATVTSARAVALGPGNGTIDTMGNNGTLSGAITGGALTKIGSGVLTLSGANSFSGGLTVDGGSVVAGSATAFGPGGLTVTSGTANLDGNSMTLAGLSGAGDVDLGSATLTVDQAGSSTFSGSISGSGGLVNAGGELTLSGTSSYTGPTTVDSGTLRIDGSITSAVTVNGGILSGSGAISGAGGNVTVKSGGTLLSYSDGTEGVNKLTIGGRLSVEAGGQLNYTYGLSPNDDHDVLMIEVAGDVDLNGTLNVDNSSGTSLDSGIYGLIHYGGALTGTGLTTGSMPSGLIVQTSVAGRVNLVNTAGLSLDFWDPTGVSGDGEVKGGSGTWTASGGESWTDEAGKVNTEYKQDTFAIFAGTGGTVTVDGSAGDISVTGMQFTVDGYTITGDPITLNNETGSAEIVVGDRSGTSAQQSVTIESVLQGSAQLVKEDVGTLILKGENTYTGGTLIKDGILQVSSDGNLGAASGGVGIDGGTLQFAGGFDSARAVRLGSGGGTIDTMGNTDTLSGVVSGTGGLVKEGAGTLVLSGENSYSGGTAIRDGVVRVSSDANLGSAAGDLSLDGGTLQYGAGFESTRDMTLGAGGGTLDTMENTDTVSGVISGAGGLTKDGAGTLVLTGDNTYAGGTAVDAGILQIGDGGTSGSIDGDVALASGTQLIIDRADAVTLDGAISGAGKFVQAGTGTTVLSGLNSYKGGTDITGGVLQVSSDANLGDASGPLKIDGGVLQYGASFDSVRDMTLGSAGGTIDTMDNTDMLAGVIAGEGGFTKAGDGTLVLTGNNTYAGGTTVSAGILQIGNGGTSGSIAGDVALAEGTELIVKRSDDVTLPGAVSGAGSLIQAGSGTTTLTGPATHTGDTDIEDGILRLAGNGSLETSDRVKADATFDISGIDGSETMIQSLAGAEGGRVTLGGKDLIIANGKDAFAGVIEGDGGLTVSGGHQTLTGDNTYKGGTLIGDDGTLEIGDGGTSGSVADPIENRGVLIYNLSGEYRINQISGDGALVQTGGGTGLIDTKQNYTSRTIIDAGNMLKLVGDGDISASSGVTADGTFDISGINADATSVKGLSGGPDGRVHLGAKGLTITAAQNDDFQGIIDGSGGLAVTGGRQILSGDNDYTGGTRIARSAALQLGHGGTAGSVKGGIAVDGLLAFDRSDTFTVDNLLTGAGTIEQIGKGTTVLAADNSGFTGTTNIRAGALAVEGSLCGAMNVLAGGRLQGTGRVCGDTGNAGTVAPGNSIGTLTIDGNYTGHGGTLEIETVLSGDNSPTDLLVVTGDTSGQTYVRVINRGGLGARTSQGIKIIDVEGQSEGSFTLLGDYTTRDGTSAVIGGAYAYTLNKNGIATPGDGDWYLRSQYAPQPGTPLYEAHGQVLARLNTIATLAERTGNRYWSGAGNLAIAQGDGPSEELGFSEPGPGPALTEAGLVWSRIEAAHGRYHLDQSLTDARYDIDLWRLEAGVDGLFYENARGRLIGSVWAGYGTATADIASFYGQGRVEVGGTGLGAALTWYDDAGYYLDGKGQFTWFDSDLNSATLRRSLADGHKALGYALSLESGQRIALDDNWLITPQAQLTYAALDLDGFTDPFGAKVAYDNPDSLTARIGIAANYQSSWQDAMGFTRQADLYGVASLYRAFLGRNKWSVSGERFTTTEENVWAEIGAGGTYNWNDGRYGMFAKIAAQSDLDDFAQSYTISGNLAFKVKW